MISYFSKHPQSLFGGFNLGGINASGQIPAMAGNWGLVDLDTPRDAYTKKDYVDGKDWQLIWSDEFNVDGRTFYPGDDPYWEAVDLHSWQTDNMEWYDPAAITTQGGALVITLSENSEHNLNYTGGMMSTWNKFCFTGGLLQGKTLAAPKGPVLTTLTTQLAPSCLAPAPFVGFGLPSGRWVCRCRTSFMYPAEADF